MPLLILRFVAFACAFFICACELEPQPSPDAGELLRSPRARETSPSVDPDELASFAAGELEFAWELFDAVKEEPDNLFFSPYGLYVSLGMTFAGARGQTASEMAEALHFAMAPELTHGAFNAFDLAMSAKAAELADTGASPFVLQLTQGLFAQLGEPVAAPFLDTLARHYDAGMRLLDFDEAPERARQAINRWVEEQTEGRVDELLPRGSVDSRTALVLANAIHFGAAWAMPFDPEQTSDEPFTLLDGSQVLVPTMHRYGRTADYMRGDGYEAVSLDYDGAMLRMVLIVPDEGLFETVQNQLDAGAVREIRDALRSHELDLALPKFGFEASLGAKAALSALGMKSAFTEAADFSGMSSSRDLHIDEAVHQAFVSIDELGTEAGAATGIVIRPTSIPPRAVLFIDRPFLFFVEDIQTGVTLFIGRVLDPSH